MTKEEQNAATKAAIERIQELNEVNGGYCIRFGEALPLKEPKYVSIHGTIDAPARWIEKRKDDIVSADAHVLVDRDRMTITLNTDENSAYMDQIVGTLTLSTEMQEFGINTGEYMSCFDMADRIKQLRTYFETQQEAMKLVTELRSFKAKIDKELELLGAEYLGYSPTRTSTPAPSSLCSSRAWRRPSSDSERGPQSSWPMSRAGFARVQRNGVRIPDAETAL